MDPIRKHAEAIQVGVFRHPSVPMLSPADVELIIFVITTLITYLPACFGGQPNRIYERMAYRWIRTRPFFAWRTDTIRTAARKEWINAGGSLRCANYISDSIEHLSRNVTWEDFHDAWVKLYGE
jgi:hypothetical protein